MNKQATEREQISFTVFGPDPAAPVAIRAWQAERIRLGLNKATDPQIVFAEATAKIMAGEKG